MNRGKPEKTWNDEFVMFLVMWECRFGTNSNYNVFDSSISKILMNTHTPHHDLLILAFLSFSILLCITDLSYVKYTET